MPDLDYRKFTIARITAFIEQIELLNEVDFPYNDSSEALNVILKHIGKQKENIQNSVLESDALPSKCDRATSQLFTYQRFLGYISRSADPINSFEIYFSLRRLTETIFGKGTKLIISPEWEHYSPVNFTITQEMENFVFIGLPVSETENSLIIPLFGHELGHSIWNYYQINHQSFEEKYRSKLRSLLWESLKEKLEFNEISIITDISLTKCAEYFCDFIGLGLFGESYFHAFAYLIAPQVSKELIHSHPNSTNRAIALSNAAKEYGYKIPDNFKDLFKTQLGSIQTHYERLKKSEEVSFKMIDFLINDVKKLLSDKNVLYKKSDEQGEIIAELISMVPTRIANSLADVTNAAWEVYFTNEKWNDLKLSEDDKIKFLNELTIKSFEILEINQRIRDNNAT